MIIDFQWTSICISPNKMNMSQRILVETLENKEWNRSDFISPLEKETRKTRKRRPRIAGEKKAAKDHV